MFLHVFFARVFENDDEKDVKLQREIAVEAHSTVGNCSGVVRRNGEITIQSAAQSGCQRQETE